MAGLTHRLAGMLGGVRGRMLLLLLIAGIPVTGIALSNALRDHAAALEDGRRSVLAARANLAARQSAILDSGEALLRTLARLDLASDGRCAEMLRRTRDLQVAPLSDIRIARPDGSIICSADPGARERLEAPLVALVRAAGDAMAPVIGPIQRGGDARLGVLPIAVPAARQPEDPGPRSVVLGTIALRELTPTGAELPGDVAAWIVDAAGVVVPLSSAATRPPRSPRPPRRRPRGSAARPTASIWQRPRCAPGCGSSSHSPPRRSRRRRGASWSSGSRS
ncbi:hypothetical protein ACE7GA_14865 [Roseomonas sp. CCTCC AB2023176]|uniref:hypothetical protein n=1 Tax=Roseomonas sp. CCTCC AB2023176 TaxID=3342640 RepID=UPI0035E0B4FB